MLVPVLLPGEGFPHSALVAWHYPTGDLETIATTVDEMQVTGVVASLLE